MKKNVNIAPRKQEFDAIVVGSGVSGGWAAKELCEKGLNTVVLERGRHVEHGEDYVTEHKGAWQMPFRGIGDRQTYKQDYAYQSQAGPFNEYNKHFFVKDSEHPYDYDEERPFLWIRGYHLGGRSITWGRQVYRWSDLDFAANKTEGIAIDWPIRYQDIAPWYSRVEKFIGVSGEKLGLDHLPDGEFLPPMSLNCVEQHVREGIEENFPDRTMTIGRCAILTEQHQGRAACHYCGPCSRGCTPASYFCALSSTLPAAEKTGNLTVETDAIVHSVIYDAEKGRATGVRVIDRETKEEREVLARVVFLCASAIGSTQILLNSKPSAFPDGLANRSGALGRYVMDHHFKVGAVADFEGFEDDYYYGNRPNGVYIPRFRNLGTGGGDVDFTRGYGYQGGAYRESWGRGSNKPGFGKDFKLALREPGKWKLGLTAFGEILPREDNYVALDPEKTDEWGIPLVVARTSLGENERKMREDMKTAAAEMLEAAGGKNVTTYEDTYAIGEGIHEMGTARMGRDPETSVLNKWNQAHDVPNLFVTDGACMTSASCVNPSITYMALTARAADYAVREMKRGNL